MKKLLEDVLADAMEAKLSVAEYGYGTARFDVDDDSLAGEVFEEATSKVDSFAKENFSNYDKAFKDLQAARLALIKSLRAKGKDENEAEKVAYTLQDCGFKLAVIANLHNALRGFSDEIGDLDVDDNISFQLEAQKDLAYKEGKKVIEEIDGSEQK